MHAKQPINTWYGGHKLFVFIIPLGVFTSNHVRDANDKAQPVVNGRSISLE